MIGQNPKSQRRKIIITLVVLLVLSSAIFAGRNTKPVLFFEGIIQYVFAIPKRIVYVLGKKDNDLRVIKLTKENQLLTQKLVDYELLKRDNDALKSQFQISSSTTQNLVAATIIGFAGEKNAPSQLILNAGIKDGIKKGMTVIFQKYLVGKIDTVSQNYSVVTTPLNSKFQVLAKLPDTGANGILLGKSDFMLFDGVVITDTLKKNGVIVTKGEVDQNGVGVVPDMIIGKISSISKNETSPFQSAQIMPLLDFSKLTDVFIISQM